MGKFKIGQWVRRTGGTSLWSAAGIHGEGFVGQIDRIVNDSYEEDLVFTNGQKGIANMYEPWQPKVGDRVRVTYSHGWDGEGVVEIVSDIGINVKMETGGFAGSVGGFGISDLSPLPVAAEAQPVAWVPKVGDKVRFREVFVSEMYTKGKVYEIRRGDDGYFFLTDDRWNAESGKHQWNANQIALHFDHVQPLTIEAGKFYRTRDGRKVGPMYVYKFSDLAFSELDDQYGRMWKPDGTRFYDNDPSSDLIAEWPSNNNNVGAQVDTLNDEYGPVRRVAASPSIAVAAAPPASNDNGAGKFKVGDRVVRRNYMGEGDCYGTVSDITVDGRRVFAEDWSVGAPDGYLEADELDLIEPANDNDLTVAISLDARGFREELDAIIAKLERAIELKRKLAA